MPDFVPLDFYLLRLPLLSFEKLATLPENSNNDASAFAAAMGEVYQNVILQEAIYLASPALHDEMKKWLDSEDISHPRHQKLILALYRYLLRMSARATPYGLFAGCATGEINEAPSRIEINTTDAPQKVTRLDMNYLSEIAATLLNIPEVRSQVRFFPNNSLYLNGETYRYFEYHQQDKRRHYFLSGFTCTPYISAVMVAAANGATLSQLTDVLTAQQIPEKDASGFLHILIENQILTAETDPAVTGGDYLARMILLLQRCSQPPAAVIKPLQEIQQLLGQQQHGILRYEAIREIVNKHFPDINGKDFIQTDLFFTPTANSLKTSIIHLLAGELEQLAVLTKPVDCPDLKTFIQQFSLKYDQREIPLMMALDSESGIGYGIVAGDNASYTPLIDDLIMPGGKSTNGIIWDARQHLVLNKFLQAQQSGATSVSISPEELEDLAARSEKHTLPPSMFMMGALVAASPQAMDAGSFSFVLKACAGPRILSLLGRFAAGNNQLASLLREQVQREQDSMPERIMAEVVHLPEGRTGNVLLRPRLYDYEIPFLANASVPPEFQIPVSDLYVTVRNNKVVLRSRRLGKEIIPRLTSAHNSVRGLPVYKFLCDLQHQQDASALSWDWSFLADQPFLPAVHYRHIVLSRVKWNLSATEFRSLLEQLSPTEALWTLWKKYKIPEHTLLTEGDNELLININSHYATLLVTEKLKKGNVVLLEHHFNPDVRITSGNNGAYCNEVIIPLLNNAYHHQAATPAPPVLQSVKRIFTPGSEWIYAKIYCGSKWMDKLLTREVFPLLNALQQAGMVKQWFFVRYQDPDNHLRIRILQTPAAIGSNEVANMLEEIFHPYLEDDIVKRLQYDTYIRELERYGEHTMSLSEDLFFHDSEAVAKLLLFTPGSETVDRWLFALKGTDDMMTAFGLSDTEKLDMCRSQYNSFFAEFNGNDALLLQLNNKYRQHTKLIANILRQAPGDTSLSPKAVAVFEERAAIMKMIYQEMEQMAAAGIIPAQMYLELLPHYIHMFMNRIFVANARLHELVIHHYLTKYYASQVAQKSKLMS